MTKMKFLSGALALAAMAHSPAAMAQQCISEQEVASLAIYVMPLAIDSMREACAGTLSQDGFLATGGDQLRARYSALGDANWPHAKSALFKFMDKPGGSKSGDTEQFKQLPDDVTRPLLDAIFTQKIGESIKQKDCGKVERGMKLLSPIEPQDAGALIGYVAALAGVKNPPICRDES